MVLKNEAFTGNLDQQILKAKLNFDTFLQG